MWQCGLCSHIYDESKESIPWGQLPDEWVCPICGSPKSSFVPLQAQSDTPPADPSPCPADDPCARYQCDLCSHIYDEAREDVRWDDLPDDWVCPVCGSGKASFIPITSPALTPAAGTAPSPADTRDDYLAGRVFPDAVCYTIFFIDIHDDHGGGVSDFLDEGVVPTIPLGALIPRHSSRLLIAGRCISSVPLVRSRTSPSASSNDCSKRPCKVAMSLTKDSTSSAPASVAVVSASAAMGNRQMAVSNFRIIKAILLILR